MRSRAEVNRDRAGMARGRLQPPRPPKLHRCPVQPLRFPASQASPGKQPQECARSRFHTSDSTQPPTAICPLHCGPPVERETCGSGGTTSDGRVVHRQEGATATAQGPAATYVLRPDEHHVRPPLHGQTGRQRSRTTCLRVRARSSSGFREPQCALISGPLEKRTWRRARGRLS